MHELSLMEAVVDKALAVAREAGAPAPVRIEVSVGELCGIVPTAWEMAFEAATAGTAMEGARMDWRVEPARVQCPSCAHEYPPDDIIWTCPACGAFGGDAIEGGDIVLLRVEVAAASRAESNQGADFHGD